MTRYSILSMMMVVALVCLGLAAMRDGSAVAENMASLSLFLALCLSLLGSIVRRGSPGWVGFTVLAGGYTATFYLPEHDPSVTSRGLHVARQRFGLDTCLNMLIDPLYEMPADPSPLPYQIVTRSDGAMRKLIDNLSVPLTELETAEAKMYLTQKRAYQSWYSSTSSRRRRAAEIGHLMIALSFGAVGSLAGRLLSPHNSIHRESAHSGITPAPGEATR
ncbi:MAG TPA: hypothetical protein VFT74_12670 [Isosphaeraceae bacterium]|nr:hypothetical protein [Isosphaeraceae bacterium]